MMVYIPGLQYAEPQTDDGDNDLNDTAGVDSRTERGAAGPAATTIPSLPKTCRALIHAHDSGR